ncbi:MAG: hypothetical protein KF868_20295 [Acidobacteria bacterium]|nr:hypothetical protein [Acidobacteriota bacterium]MCW5971620.1 hypothetical protein [Blastocatellales bacterium]
MRREFLHQMLTLAGLRYRLIWASARTTSGRLALLFVLYVLVMITGLFFALGGLSAAIAAVQSGEGELVARGVLTGLMVSAVMTSLVFGVGPRAAFSDNVLRRYPLNFLERLAGRHLVGLLDPIWFLLAASAVGLAVGLAWLGSGSLVSGLPAALFYIAICYLTTITLLGLLDRILNSTTGAMIFGGAAILAFSLSGIGLSWLVENGRSEWLAGVDAVLRWMPPGLAAAPMAGAGAAQSLANMALLVVWGVLLLRVAGWSERRPATSEGASHGAIVWENMIDRAARLAGARYFALADKALRYNLRSNRVRFGLATAPVFAFVGRLMALNDESSNEFYFALAFFAFLGFSGPSSVLLNQFGSDGAGARRYALLPVSFADVVRAGSLAAIGLGAIVIPPTIALWAAVTAGAVEWRMIAMLAGTSAAGLFFFNALGLWTTILAPRRVDFTSMLGNQLSFAANVVVMGGMILIFAAYFGLLFLRAPLDRVLELWWTPVAMTAAALVFYFISWRLIEVPAETRRNSVIDLVAEKG